MIRTFLAVELSDDLRMHIAQLQQDLKQRLLRDVSKDVRISWVQPASIHLTIKFLGETDEQLVEPLRHAIGDLVSPQRSLRLPIDRLGVFPHAQQPRVLWVGPGEEWERGDDATRLGALHGAVDASCSRFGVRPEDRPWSPHLTLARVKEGERRLGQALVKTGVMDRPVSLGCLAVGSVVLMKSELRPTGPVYTKLWDVVMSG